MEINVLNWLVYISALLVNLPIFNVYERENLLVSPDQPVFLTSDFQSEIGCSQDFDINCAVTQFSVKNDQWVLRINIPQGSWHLYVHEGTNKYGQKGTLNGPPMVLNLARSSSLSLVYDPSNHALLIGTDLLESRAPIPALTLSDSLIFDPNMNMIANPGDSIQYTMILRNQSGSPMTGITIDHTGDPNVTFDPNSVKASPLAFNDTFTYDMHPKSVLSAFGVLANDFDLNDPLPNPPFNSNLIVVRVNGTSLGSPLPTVGGGTVTMMSDGSFSYDSTGVNGAITDVFTYAVLDLDGFEDSAQVLIQFNMAPVISSGLVSTDSICAFEQRDTFLMSTAFTITDDGTMISSATIEICNNYLPTEDTLIPGALPMGINAIWTDGSGTLMLVGIASLADYETAIENIQYLNSSENPNTATRTICITVNDGTLNSNEVIRFLKVKRINDCPIAVRDTVAILENQSITMFNVLANDIDVDMDMLSVTKLNGGMTLSGMAINGGTITNLSSSGVLNFMHTTGFNGLDSLSEGEIFYTRFEYTASDGLCEDADSVIIKITGVNDAPVIASNLMATDSICAFEQRDTFLFTSAFTLMDDEDNTDSATIQICNNYMPNQDTLIPGVLPGGIIALWNDATGTLKLYGSTAKANYEAAIEAVQYLNSSNTPNTTPRRICVSVHDGDLMSMVITRELKIKPVNDCPVAFRDTVSILENQSITLFNVLDNDTDIELDPLSVTRINGNLTLSGVNINGGTINNLSSAGVLNFTHTTGFNGLDSLSEGEIFYTRFEYTASDGLCEDADSVIIKITGVNDAPVIASNLMATDSICAFEQRDTFLFTSAFTLMDDEDNTDSATIQICNNYLPNQDTLIPGVLPGGITALWNDATGTLKLYGSTAKGNYEAAIEAIQYLNSSDIPNMNGRRICITVHDSALISNQVTRELKVKPVNDCPVAVRDTLSITENGSTAAGFVLTNDTDLENDMLMVTMVNASGVNTNVNVSGGMISSSGAGAITFIHTTGATGLDTLNVGDMFFARARYTITDGLCTAMDSVIIKITGINDAPVADSNAYSVVQTASLSVAAPGILADDIDIDHLSSITVGSVNGSPANVGSMIVLTSGAELTVQSNGSFVYNPKCVVGGLDSFTYQAKDEHNLASNTAKVYLIVSQTLWFVDGAVVTTGNGSFSAPYKTLTEAQTASLAGQTIFVFPGTYAESITLKNDQKFIGADENWNCPSGSTIRSASGNSTINGTLTLAQNDTVRGIEFGNSTAGVPMIRDNGSSVLNLFIANTILNTTTSSGLRIANGGALTVTLDAFNSTSPAEAIFINNCTGNLIVSGGTINPTSGGGDTMVTIKGGTLNATFIAGISQPNNFPLSFIGGGHITGTITFQTGTLNATNGSGLQFDNADGNYYFNGTNTLNGGDAGIDILNGSSGTFIFSTNSSITRANNVSGAAFNLLSSDATVTYNGSMTLGTGTGNVVAIDNHDAGIINFNTGNLTKGSSTTQGISIQNSNGGTINFNNLTIMITMTSGNAVSLTNNSGGTINFTPTVGGNGIDLVTTSGTGFNATGGGTVNVTGSGNTISSTTGTALNVNATTIGASNLTFQSISSTGGSSTGIILDNTGSSGGLIVTGDGSNTSVGGNSSGGTISNKSGSDGATTTGCGIYFNNTSNVVLRRMTINGVNQNFGILGLGVNNFTLAYCTVGASTTTDSSNVTANLQGTATSGYGEGSIYFGNGSTGVAGLTGTANIMDCKISSGRSDNFRVTNSGGTLNRLVITGTTFGWNAALFPIGNANLTILALRPASGTTTLNSTVTNCTFTGSPGNAANFTGQEPTITLGVTTDIIFQNNTITNNHPRNIIGGCNLTIAGFSNVTFNASNNIMSGANGSAVTFQLGAPGVGSTVPTSLSGTFNNNRIGILGVPGSGSSGSGNGVFCSFADNATFPKGQVTIAITNNEIRNYTGNAGIFADNTGGAYDVHFTITGNITAEAGAGAFAGLAIAAGSPASADDIDVCAVIGGAGALKNDFSGGSPGVGLDIVVGVSAVASSMRLPGLAAITEAAIESFLFNNNTVTNLAAVDAYADNGATFAVNYLGGAACNLPSTVQPIQPTKK